MSKKLTPVELVRKMLTGLAGQNWKQSTTTGGKYGGCAYRGGDGLKCAVGHLIPDDEYREEMDGAACSVPDVLSVLRKNMCHDTLDNLQANLDLLNTVQSWHDDHLDHQGGRPMGDVWGMLRSVLTKHNIQLDDLGSPEDFERLAANG